jgi:hypothetical protein
MSANTIIPNILFIIAFLNETLLVLFRVMRLDRPWLRQTWCLLDLVFGARKPIHEITRTFSRTHTKWFELVGVISCNSCDFVDRDSLLAAKLLYSVVF